jgi:hypothetical protein
VNLLWWTACLRSPPEFTDLSDENRVEVMSGIYKASWGFEYNPAFYYYQENLV